MDRSILLQSAVESIQRQSAEDFEVIIVDDGVMPDSMHEILRDPRFIYINKKNHRRGVAASRNLGISMARGRYLCFLDDDDLLKPDFLVWMKDACNQLPGRVMFGNFEMVEELLDGTTRREISRAANRVADWDVKRILVSNFMPICSIVFPISAGLPRFDETLPSHEDWDFLLGCLSHFEFVGVDRVVCEVRQRVNLQGDHRHSSRKPYFGFDFLAIYQRHPRPELAKERAEFLQSLGLQIPVNVLENIGRI